MVKTIFLVSLVVVGLIALAATANHRHASYQSADARLHYFANRRARLSEIAVSQYAVRCQGHGGVAVIALGERNRLGRYDIVHLDALYGILFASSHPGFLVAVKCRDGSVSTDQPDSLFAKWRPEMRREAELAGESL